jgi:hypothetical protein
METSERWRRDRRRDFRWLVVDWVMGRREWDDEKGKMDKGKAVINLFGVFFCLIFFCKFGIMASLGF